MKGKNPSILVSAGGLTFLGQVGLWEGPGRFGRVSEETHSLVMHMLAHTYPKMDRTVLMRFRLGNASAAEISIVGKIWVFHRELRFCPNHRVKGKKPSILVLSRGPDSVGQVGQWEGPGRFGWVSEETHSLFSNTHAGPLSNW